MLRASQSRSASFTNPADRDRYADQQIAAGRGISLHEMTTTIHGIEFTLYVVVVFE